MGGSPFPGARRSRQSNANPLGRPLYAPGSAPVSDLRRRLELDRRDVLRLGLAGLAGAAMTACGSSPSADERRDRPAARQHGDDDSKRILLAYFSRPGENYWYGGRRDLRVGNTEVLAGMIAGRLSCDVHRIRAPSPTRMTTTRRWRATSANRRRTPARPSPIRCARSVATTCAAGQPALERPTADDHEDVRRAVRLQRQDRPARHDLRRQWSRHGRRRVRRRMRGRDDRSRARRSWRARPRRRRRHRRLAPPHRLR